MNLTMSPFTRRFLAVALLVGLVLAGCSVPMQVFLHPEADLGFSATYRRANGCFKGSQAPFSLLLATHCWIKYIPSTPSATLG